jgi:hypothetical protein
MPRSFYITGESYFGVDIEPLAAAFVAAGWRQTFDWTVSGRERIEDPPRAAQHAQLQVGGVLSADILIVVHPPGRGSYVELGVALGAGKPVLFVGGRRGDDPLRGLPPPLHEEAFYYHLRTRHHVFTGYAGVIAEAQAFMDWLPPPPPPEGVGDASILERAVEDTIGRAPPNFTRRLSAALRAYRASKETSDGVRIELDNGDLA